MTNPDSTREQPSPSAASKSEQVTKEQQPPPQQQDQREQPPPFQPLFTLVTDGSGATHHPHVHYIFSDDEPDHLTDVLAQYSARHQYHQPDTVSSGARSGTPALANDRAIVLDLVAKPPTSSDTAPGGGVNGYQVAWASSLSADWAVVSATLAPMTSAAADTSAAAQPANDAAAASSSSPPERLMLRIEGVDLAGGGGPAPHRAASNSSMMRDVSSGSGSGSSGGAPHQEDYNALVHEFDSRMAVLRKVVDAGAERQAKLAAAAQGSPDRDPPVPGVGHEEQRLDDGAEESGRAEPEKACAVSSKRMSGSHGSGPQQRERSSGGRVPGAHGAQQESS